MRLYGEPICPNPKWQQDTEPDIRLNFQLETPKKGQRMSPVFGQIEIEKEEG